jgi:hypothetical protein
MLAAFQDFNIILAKSVIRNTGLADIQKLLLIK